MKRSNPGQVGQKVPDATNVVVDAALQPPVRPATPPDTYRMVDFVKAVAMRDDRGQEVRVQRIRLGAPVDRESPMRVESIVLNGAWFDITTAKPLPDVDGLVHSLVHYYRVHVTNTVSAER